jgi:hypothetical protein
MYTIQSIILNLYGTNQSLLLLIGYVRIFIGVQLSSRAKPAARLLAAESQLEFYKHQISQKKEPRPAFYPDVISKHYGESF